MIPRCLLTVDQTASIRKTNSVMYLDATIDVHENSSKYPPQYVANVFYIYIYTYPEGVCLHTRTDGQLFNLSRLCATATTGPVSGDVIR